MDRSGRLAVLREPKIISLVSDVFICMLLHDEVYFASIVAITCEPLLFRTLNAAVDQHVHNQLWSVVNVTCPAGQRLNSSATSIVTTCNSRGAWNPPVPDCIGIYTSDQYQPEAYLRQGTSYQYRHLAN